MQVTLGEVMADEIGLGASVTVNGNVEGDGKRGH